MATAATPNPEEGTTTTQVVTPPPAPSVTTVNQSTGRIYTQEEVNRLLGEVRTEEKNKLYRDLDHYRSKSTDLENQIKDLKGQKEQATNAQQTESIQKEIEALQAKVRQAEQEKDQLVEQAVEKATAIARKEFEKQRLKDRVEDRKQVLIDSANGRIIPALVTGNTIEEIEASAKASREEYEKIVEKAKAEAGTGVLPRPLNVGGSATTNGQPNGSTAVELDNLWSMPESEYSKNRDSIKDKVFAELGLRRKS